MVKIFKIQRKSNHFLGSKCTLLKLETATPKMLNIKTFNIFETAVFYLIILQKLLIVTKKGQYFISQF